MMGSRRVSGANRLETRANAGYVVADAAIELKNNGMELEIRDTKGKFVGDLVVTKTGLTWCKGKVKRQNGKKVSWEKFIAAMEAE